MSAAVRQAIATAVSTVEGVTCTPYHREVTKAGESWVRLDRIAVDDSRFGSISTWQVVVLLPQNLVQAETQIDELGQALIEATEDVWAFQSLTPGQIPIANTTVPCVVLEGARAN